MTGLDVDAEKDQEALDASALASEMLDCPSPCRQKTDGKLFSILVNNFYDLIKSIIFVRL